MFNVKHKTTGGIKASAATSIPCSFLLGEIRLKSLREKKKFGGKCNDVFSTRKLGKQTINHTQLWSTLLFTSNWQKERHEQHLPSRVPKCPRLCSQRLAQTNSEDPRPRLKSMRPIDFCFRLLSFVGGRVPVSPLLGGEHDRDSRDSIQYL